MTTNTTVVTTWSWLSNDGHSVASTYCFLRLCLSWIFLPLAWSILRECRKWRYCLLNWSCLLFLSINNGKQMNYCVASLICFMNSSSPAGPTFRECKEMTLLFGQSSTFSFYQQWQTNLISNTYFTNISSPANPLSGKQWNGGSLLNRLRFLLPSINDGKQMTYSVLLLRLKYLLHEYFFPGETYFPGRRGATLSTPFDAVFPRRSYRSCSGEVIINPHCVHFTCSLWAAGV